MNKLINVTLNKNQEPVVSGRQLHQVLGVKTPKITGKGQLYFADKLLNNIA